MKTIKFNLSYGDERIKTFDELKDKCNIDMLLETLDNGQLVRWLVAQGKSDEAEKIKAINTEDKRRACGELLKLLFDKDASVYEQAAAELFSLREQEKLRLESFKELEKQETEIIVQYHKGYENTLAALKTNADDYPKLKALMNTLDKRYGRLLILDITHFYNEFKKVSPLVLLALVANEALRERLSEKLLEQIYKDLPLTSGEIIDDKKWNEIQSAINRHEKPPVKVEWLRSEEQRAAFNKVYAGKVICRFSNSGRFGWGETRAKRVEAEEFLIEDGYCPLELMPPSLPSYVKTFRGKTDAYWKDIEPKEKRFMIISMNGSNKLRSTGASGEELTANDINGKFPITNGIDYMSNSETETLVYMEV